MSDKKPVNAKEIQPKATATPVPKLTKAIMPVPGVQQAAPQIQGQPFDFSKVHRTMVALEWKWASAEDGIPTEPEIRETARRLMEDAINKKVSIGTGGFRVHYDKKDDFISLSFVISEWDETF